MRTNLRISIFAATISGLVGVATAQQTSSQPTNAPAQPSTAPGAVTRTSPQSAPATVTQPTTQSPTTKSPATQSPATTNPGTQTAPERVAQPVRPMVPPPVSQPGVTNNATTAIDANAPVAVSGVSVDALAAAGIDVAVDPQTVIASLQRANRTTAATAVSELRARIEATTRALNELRTEAKATGMQVDGALLEQATADLRSQENMLRQALTNASRASNDAEWRQAQAQLATQYQLYAQAVRRTQTILGR